MTAEQPGEVAVSRLGVAGSVGDGGDGADAVGVDVVGVDGSGRLHFLTGASDGSGGLGRGADGWIDWWIGADDRWHRPAREAAVRQRRLDDAPVVETLLRVPGGDAVQRVYGVHLGRGALGGEPGPEGSGGGGAHLVIEVVNSSRLPFALALALGPAAGAAWHGSSLHLGDRLAFVARRAPSRWSEASDVDALFEAVTQGASTELELGAGSLDGSPPAEGAGAVAAIWPLAHGANLRLLVPLVHPADAGGTRPGRPRGQGQGKRPARRGGLGDSQPSPTGPVGDAPTWPALPEAEQVARGWRRHVESGSRVQLPDGRLQGIVSVARAELMLAAAGDGGGPWLLARRISLLCAWGHEEEARGVLARFALLMADDGDPLSQAAFLVAMAAYREGTDDGGAAAAAASEVAGAADIVLRALRRRRSAARGAGDGRASGPLVRGDDRSKPVLSDARASTELLQCGLRAAAALGAPGLGATGPPGRRRRLGRRGAEVAVGTAPPAAAVGLGWWSAVAGASFADEQAPVSLARRGEVSWLLRLRALLDARVLAEGLPRRPTVLDGTLAGVSESAGAPTRSVAVWDDELMWEVLAGVHGALLGCSPEGDLLLGGAWPPDWEGQPFEVHRLVVGAAVVSYAVRWHGPRPALLWEIDPRSAGGLEPPIVRAPGLDAVWRARAWRGEALLAAPANGARKAAPA